MVKKKDLLVLVAVVVTIAVGALPALAATYYVKNGGNDAASGLSDAAAWATVYRVNSQTFSPGDTICFKAGDTWRLPTEQAGGMQLTTDSGSAGVYVTYTSYGDDPNMPLFLGSLEKNSTSDWTNTGGNKWATANGSFIRDVGNLIFNNEQFCGSKEWNLADLNVQGEFWYDSVNQKLVLYSTSNPATYYSDIECAVKKHIINFANRNYVIIENLDLRYTGAHGIWGESASYIIIRDNDISYIGGSQQSGTTRYGNGIELWNSVNNIWVERNRIWEAYDNGITNQSGSWAAFTQYNLYFRYNVIWNTGVPYVYFTNNAATVVYNIYVENNTIVNTGYGWSYPENNKAWALKFWSKMGIVSNFYVRNNIIYESRDWCLSMDNPQPGKIMFNYNCWYKASKGMIYYGGANYTMAQFANYQSATGQDASSIAANPVFVDLAGGNYRLQDSSPCIDTALNTGQTEDFDYNPIIPAGSPDMGAFEWTLASDFDHNGAVDFLDYALFGGAWRTTPADSDYDDAYDLVDNDSIDYDDLGNFTNDWLWSA
ncbi:MAG TPA: hypothetical protein ENH34_01600, partial [Phycisphaerales bacterium]|nr:hypothetical protein [Phycisphaerales bacterium]